MNTLATSAIVSDMDTLADISANITSVANIASNVTSVANNSSNINSAVSNASNINAAVSNASKINTVAGISANVTTVAGNNSNITTVAGANSNISTVASSIANVNTTASNISNVNNFANTYQIASSNPSTDGGGNSLAAGDLYFNTSSNELRVYNGSAWQGGVTATGNLAGLGANTFTGNQTIQNTAPSLAFIDTDNNSDFSLFASQGEFRVRDQTNTTNRITIASDGTTTIDGNLDCSSGLDVTGNITVSGTVDGVDIAALNSTVAGITSNATHTGEVTGSGALTIADNVVDEANLKVSNSPTNGYFLQAQSGNTGGLTWAEVDLSSKFNTTGGTISGNVAINGDVKVYDDKVLAAGNSYDVYLYKAPSGGASYLRNTTEDLIISQQTNTDNIKFRVGSSEDKGWNINNAGHFLPMADSTYDLGLTGTRVRNVYADTYYGDGSNLTGIAAGVTSDSQENTVAGTNAGDAFNGTEALENTLFGYDAGTDITTGDYNTAFGATALPDCTSGYGNVAIGRRTFFKVTTGYNNTGAGFQAGEKLTTGHLNVAIGAYSLYKATTANQNVAIGNNAMNETTTGDENTAVGQGSLHENQTGEYNVAIGQNALAYSHNDYQTAAGYKAGYNSNGSNNTYIGHRTGYSQSGASANYNAALGSRALQNTSTGKENVAIGYDAGYTNSSGDENVFIGEATGYANTTANRNTFVGRRAGQINTTGADNVFYGWRAGDNVTTGSNNIVIGAGADASAATVSNEVTIGDSNITKFRVPAIGLEAEDGILSLKTGSGSVAEARFYCESSNAHYVAIKSPAHSAYSGNVSFVLPPNGGTNGYFLKTDGSGNTSWAAAASGVSSDSNLNTVGGTNAGDSISGGYYNVCFGYDAGTDITSENRNTFIGSFAGANTTTDDNVALGYKALFTGTNGYYNTAIGKESLELLTSGIGNVAVGYKAGDNITTGDNNTVIGKEAEASSATVDNEITLGNTNVTKFRIPAFSYEVTANAVTQGGCFYENAQTVSSDYTVTNGRNAMAAGDITIASGVTVTVGADETLTIV